MKSLKAITNIYNKMSNFGKILLFITILLAFIVFFKTYMPSLKKEGFQQIEKFKLYEGNNVYDYFYADIYDYLVFNNLKNDYEVLSLMNTTLPDSSSIIVDIGSGTGHHVKQLSDKGFNATGVDISKAMIDKSKENYPNEKFIQGDALDPNILKYSSVTHILCMYFTIYYFEDKKQFFDNCMDWLMPGGYLIVHLVDREKFDPILPPGNPLYIVSPQKYAKERITHTKVNFNDFTYYSDFNLDADNNIATFDEKFKFNDGNVRKQQQKLYMDTTSNIVNMAQDCGFIIQGKIDLLKCAYEYQYLYIFEKPSTLKP
jgi:SAM-dependent methyltransferase